MYVKLIGGVYVKHESSLSCKVSKNLVTYLENLQFQINIRILDGLIPFENKR